MTTLKYIIKRLLYAVLILLGVSVIIYGLSRMMPTDYVDQTFQSALAQGTMTQTDVDRIKELYGLNMPDAFLDIHIASDDEKVGDLTLRKNTKVETYENYQEGYVDDAEWFEGDYESGDFHLILRETDSGITYSIQQVLSSELTSTETEGEEDAEEDSGDLTFVKTTETLDEGTCSVENGALTFLSTRGHKVTGTANYKAATFWNKLGALFGGYFTWLFNLLRGEMGMSFKYKRPVEDVIMQHMGISFAIAFVATILEFAIAIPLGIKAAVNQYGVIDYTVTILVMIGISLPTFFLAALVIRVFAVKLGWFPVGGLKDALAPGTSGIVVFGNVLWHMVLPMFVLVVLSVGSLMRYTRTNTLEVLNSDYIRTARAKGLSERSVIYKHAFRNTMIPLITMMAGILPSLFGGAMITETVFAIPGIGKQAYDALIVADVPFIMGYNMFLAVMTVIGTLLSDLMYAVVDPRVKLT